MQTGTHPLLEMRAVSRRFVQRADLSARIARALGAGAADQTVHAVDRVSLALHAAEVVGLVGESGCGKSTLGRMAAGLQGLSEGERHWQGEEVGQLAKRLGERQFRQEMLRIQLIFQDPYASLNPRMRVRQIVGEAPVVHGLVDARQQEDYVAELLRKVGIDPQVLHRFAHQFSGGQRARVGIARALAVQPTLLICDESVAALDVSIQAQVINLFMRLRQELRLTYLFISHDLALVRHISDRILVMYLGRVVESASTAELFREPLHPYTQGLLAAAPVLQAGKRSFAAVRGEIPSPLDPPRGCHFHPRCPRAVARCAEEAPALSRVAAGRWVACHLVDG